MANPPGAPSLAQGAANDLIVTWATPAVDATHGAASGFNLRYSLAGTAAWTTLAGIASPYDLQGLAPGTAFDVQVQAWNASGSSAWSGSGTLATAPAAPYAPNAPVIAGAAPPADGTTTVLTVTWAASAIDGTHDTASGYNLRYSPSGAGTWTTVPGVVSPYALSGLSSGSAFDVQVLGSNAGGSSAWSATRTASTATAVPLAPNAPVIASVAPPGDGTTTVLTVTWAASSTDGTHGAASGYNLRYSPSGAGTWTTVPGVVSPYALSGLSSGSAFDVQVLGLNAGGSSAWSATRTASTASAGPLAPNAPVIVTVAPPPDGTNTRLTVAWTAPASDSTHGAATGYNVRFSPAGAGTWTTVPGVASPYTLTGLATGAAMDIQVQATNGAASPSAWSASVTGTSWAVTVAPGNWRAAASQVHATGVAPNGGVQAFVVPTPTAVVFAWSGSNATIPTTGLIAAGGDGQPNGWGQFFNAPATAGTYYLWTIAQGTGGTTTGALVSSAITVS